MAGMRVGGAVGWRSILGVMGIVGLLTPSFCMATDVSTGPVAGESTSRCSSTDSPSPYPQLHAHYSFNTPNGKHHISSIPPWRLDPLQRGPVWRQHQRLQPAGRYQLLLVPGPNGPRAWLTSCVVASWRVAPLVNCSAVPLERQAADQLLGSSEQAGQAWP